MHNVVTSQGSVVGRKVAANNRKLAGDFTTHTAPFPTSNYAPPPILLRRFGVSVDLGARKWYQSKCIYTFLFDIYTHGVKNFTFSWPL